ncbi:MAG: DNA translocase FtsK [Spirochaetaceae bacterium]|nr:DNA translocase FtsK [Spirochaetaceae bacterium]MCF7947138.1 DNA translocase FtsK [Spirochaetia bacterium]MCF7950003.1 DNA translocase FtsK [Spirochaetaceae bacterium]
MVLLSRFMKKTLFVMTAAVVPLLTFALVIQLTLGNYGPAAGVLAAAFGPKIAATLMLLLGAAEVVAVYILTMHIFEGVRLFAAEPKLLSAPEAGSENEEEKEPKPEAKLEPKLEPEPESSEPIEELYSEAVDEVEEIEPQEWEPFEEPKGGISFPHIPAAPKLKINEEYIQPYSEEPIEIDFDKFRNDQEDHEEDFEEDFEEDLEDDLGYYAELNDAELDPEPDLETDLETELEDSPPTPSSPSNTATGDVQVYEVVKAEPVSHTGPPPPKGAQLQLREAKPVKRFTYKNYSVPEEELLKEYPDRHYWVIDEETREWAEVLKHTLEEFKISAEVTGIQKGPVITMFEILPAPGVKLSKIVNLADNIALRLAASRVRIVAPIPGKHAVGIEVPNKKRALVSFKEMLQSDDLKESDKKIPIILGKDITGETQIVDLAQTPHLLIAGATGSGKSVSVNSIICSVLYTRSPDEVRMVLIDPKIVELKLYNDIPHLLTPVITEAKRAFQALQYLLYEMERRYALLDALGVRDIGSYNRKIKRKRLATQPLPYIMVIVDEFADLMATSGKELESTLARLAAMSRAVGIHLVLATQRPSIDVITGLIKANIPSRIAFMVANKFDSRIIIDSVGADKLLGQGDMLFTSAWNPHPTRIQGAYLSEEEVEHVADYVRTLGEPDYIDEDIFFEDDEEEWDGGDTTAANDPLMNKALEVVASAGKASASYLQRRLKIGYNRAARLVEEMEHRGIVGPQNGSKAREVLHMPDEHRPE